jgi:hypothetical protein
MTTGSADSVFCFYTGKFLLMTLGQVVKYLPVVVARQFLNRAEESSSQLSPVGGQAVIEGVMMRSRKGVATAVRREDGRILVKLKPYLALAQRFRFWRLPLLRGVSSSNVLSILTGL